MTIHWKAVEQYFTVVLFVFQCYPLCSFDRFINFGLGTVRRERFMVAHKNTNTCALMDHHLNGKYITENYDKEAVRFGMVS